MKLMFIPVVAIAFPLAIAIPADAPQLSKEQTYAQPKWISFYDADGNGRLDGNEFARVRASIESVKATFRQRFDTDGDGKLSREEYQFMRQQAPRSQATQP